MRLRWMIPVLFLTTIALAAPPTPSHAVADAPVKSGDASRAKPAKPPGSKLAPPSVPHAIAMFLASWSQEGTRSVTFKAAATGTRFFVEDPSGVTVYHFDGAGYVSEAFVRGSHLAAAMKRYAAK